MKSTPTLSLAVLLLAPLTLLPAADKPLDFWDEEIRLFGVARQNQHVDAGLAQRLNPGYWYNRATPGFDLDHSDKRVGDLSIRYTPAAAGLAPRFGFVADLWGGHWRLTPALALHLWVKVVGERAPAQWDVILVDNAGRTAGGVLAGTATGGDWQAVSLPLAQLTTASGFNWGAVALCEFEAAFGKDARVHLDGIRFEGSGTYLGVTDKPLAQRQVEAKASRAARIEAAFKLSAKDDPSPAVSAFAQMYLNQDLEAANRALVEELKKSSEQKDYWSLLHTPLYCRFYYWFSNRVGTLPGRMKPEVEKLLLETLWERTVVKNDIHWARQSTWWLDGSENHDLNAKACNLVTARIFMAEPAYRDRIYPDYGFGGGYHYGHAGYYGQGVDPATRHGGGRANLADGKTYTARAHYQAWLAFLKTYFQERARRGFFLENASLTYSKHTLNFVDLAYQYSGDAGLHQVIGDFLTLYWADWAQVSISGVRGGPKTRHHKSVGGHDASGQLIGFHLGGLGSGGIWSYWNQLNDYQLPAIVWRMALDRQGMGSFVYRSRGIGEEENVWPRPLGTERSLTVDTESRFLKYTWVTPDCTLGTQMDHPAAVHSHLSVRGRWHGMTFAQSAAARIVPVAIPEQPKRKGETGSFDTEVMFRTVQHRNTLVVQQARSWQVVNPDWFPGPDQAEYGYARRIAVHLGRDWDRREEKSGWIFLQKGNAYAAVRPVLWDEAYEKNQLGRGTGNQALFHSAEAAPTVRLREDSYRWTDDRTMIVLEDRFSPVIIEAGRRADYATLEAFMADVLDNPIALHKTVVPGLNELVYTGTDTAAPEIVFNAANGEIPTVSGERVNYSHPKTFDSPYLQSPYKSGKTAITFGGERLELDFSDRR
jgi:hypothetical protein